MIICDVNLTCGVIYLYYYMPAMKIKISFHAYTSWHNLEYFSYSFIQQKAKCLLFIWQYLFNWIKY